MSLTVVAVLVLLTPALDGRLRPLANVLAALLAVAAAAVVVLAVFPTQTVAGALPAGVEWTVDGRLHDAGSGVTTITLLAASVVSLWLPSAHRAYRRTVIGLLVIATAGSIAGLAIGASVDGARQRLLLAVAIGWQILLVEMLRRRACAIRMGRDPESRETD
jgi:hypothetical protein